MLRAIDVRDNRQNTRSRHNTVDLDAGNNLNVVDLDLILLVHLLRVKKSLVDRIHVDSRRTNSVLLIVHKSRDVRNDALHKTCVLGNFTLLRNLRNQRAVFGRGRIHEARGCTRPYGAILCVKHIRDNLIERLCFQIAERAALLNVDLAIKLRERDTVNDSLDVGAVLDVVDLRVKKMVDCTRVDELVLALMSYLLKVARRMTSRGLHLNTLKKYATLARVVKNLRLKNGNMNRTRANVICRCCCKSHLTAHAVKHTFQNIFSFLFVIFLIGLAYILGVLELGAMLVPEINLLRPLLIGSKVLVCVDFRCKLHSRLFLRFGHLGSRAESRSLAGRGRRCAGSRVVLCLCLHCVNFRILLHRLKAFLDRISNNLCNRRKLNLVVLSGALVCCLVFLLRRKFRDLLLELLHSPVDCLKLRLKYLVLLRKHSFQSLLRLFVQIIFLLFLNRAHNLCVIKCCLVFVENRNACKPRPESRKNLVFVVSLESIKISLDRAAETFFRTFNRVTHIGKIILPEMTFYANLICHNISVVDYTYLKACVVIFKILRRILKPPVIPCHVHSATDKRPYIHPPRAYYEFVAVDPSSGTCIRWSVHITDNRTKFHEVRIFALFNTERYDIKFHLFQVFSPPPLFDSYPNH
nr:MAG TPA: hypothetical protein [Caudoviricetes sp.]